MVPEHDIVPAPPEGRLPPSAVRACVCTCRDWSVLLFPVTEEGSLETGEDTLQAQERDDISVSSLPLGASEKAGPLKSEEQFTLSIRLVSGRLSLGSVVTARND